MDPRDQTARQMSELEKRVSRLESLVLPKGRKRNTNKAKSKSLAAHIVLLRDGGFFSEMRPDGSGDVTGLLHGQLITQTSLLPPLRHFEGFALRL